MSKDIDSIIELQKLGIKLPQNLKKEFEESNNYTSKRENSNELKQYHDIFSNEYSKCNENRFNDESLWYYKQHVYKKISSRTSKIINEYISNNDIEFPQLNIQHLLSYIEQKIVPKVKEYYLNKVHVNGKSITPWNYSILDFQVLHNIQRNEGKFGSSIIYLLPSSLYEFKEHLEISFNEGFWDLKSYKEKPDYSFALNFPNKNRTFISIYPENSIFDSIYLGHEIGHAFYNYMNKKDFNVSNSETVAYIFQNYYSLKFIKSSSLINDYIYEFDSGICLHALKHYFIYYCLTHANSTKEEKSENFNKGISLFTPWLIIPSEYKYIENNSWCNLTSDFLTPFYSSFNIIAMIRMRDLLLKKDISNFESLINNMNNRGCIELGSKIYL